MPKRVNTRWLKGLEKNKQEDFEKLLRNTRIVLNRLKVILEEDQKELLKVKEADYEKPSWSALQAHKNGEIASLTKVLSLLDFLE